VLYQKRLIQAILFTWNFVRLLPYYPPPSWPLSVKVSKIFRKGRDFSIESKKSILRFNSQGAHDHPLAGVHEQNDLCQKQGIYVEPIIHQGTGIDSIHKCCESRKSSCQTDAKFSRLIQVLKIECSTALSTPQVARKPGSTQWQCYTYLLTLFSTYRLTCTLASTFYNKICFTVKLVTWIQRLFWPGDKHTYSRQKFALFAGRGNSEANNFSESLDQNKYGNSFINQ